MSALKTIIDISGKLYTLKNDNLNLLLSSNVLRRELLHSDIIAKLIDTNYDGSLERVRLLFRCLQIKEFPNYSLKDPKSIIVSRETDNIDILIELLNEKTAIIIENKVDARDQPAQISNYVKTLKGEKYNYEEESIHVVYLTPLGWDPSVDSIGDYTGPITPCSYKEHIIKWLQTCDDKPEAFGNDNIRCNIRLYREMIEEMVNDSFNEREAASAVFEAGSIEPNQTRYVLNASQKRCHVMFLQELMQELQQRGLKIETDINEIKQSAIEGDDYGFCVTMSDQYNWVVEFNWNNGNYRLGTGLQPVSPGTTDQNVKDRIEHIVNKKSIPCDELNPNDYWYLWRTTNSSGIGNFKKNKDNEYASSIEWQKWAKEYADKFLDDYDSLKRVFTEYNS
jgi:hypothetical protein